MKIFNSLFLSAIVVFMASTSFSVSGARAATEQLDIGSLAGTFPSYTDASGITIVYNNGLIVDADRQNGLNGVPMLGSVVPGDTPHLTVAAQPPGDSVTIDFTAALLAIVPGTIRIHLYDLDSPGGFTERAEIIDLTGTTVHIGVAGNSPTTTELAAPQTRRDVGVGLRVDVWVDPKSDRGDDAGGPGARIDDVQLLD